MAAQLLAQEIDFRPASADWRLLRGLTAFRCLVGGGLLGLYVIQQASGMLTLTHPALFAIGVLALLMFAALAVTALRLRRPSLGWQTVIQAGGDVLLLSLLAYASGGAAGGLGALVLVPVFVASLLLNLRLTAFLAAFATLTLLVMEGYRILEGAAEFSALTPVGLLGLILFASSLTSVTLARRARRGEALAQRVGGDLRSLARLNESVIARMRSGVIVLVDDDIVELANPAARSLLQLKPPVRQQPLSALCPPLSRQLALWRGEAASGTRPLEGPEPFDARGGRSVIPQFISLGVESRQLLITLEDATAMTERAQQLKLAAVGRLSASIAHEIRNPLAAITHASQLLGESQSLPADDRELAQIIDQHGARIEQIVQSVLSVARPDARQPQRIRLRKFVDALAAEFKQGVPGQVFEIDAAGIASDLVVLFDKLQLQRLLSNLWHNSLSHAAPARALRIHVRARLDADVVQIDVLDNGAGVPPALAARLFEPFFTTRGTGTGLGLFMAREIARDHGGQLAFVPPNYSDAEGAHFRLLLPQRARELE